MIIASVLTEWEFVHNSVNHITLLLIMTLCHMNYNIRIITSNGDSYLQTALLYE